MEKSQVLLCNCLIVIIKSVIMPLWCMNGHAPFFMVSLLSAFFSIETVATDEVLLGQNCLFDFFLAGKTVSGQGSYSGRKLVPLY